ncbi:MAG: hypothetical protein JWM92_80 [Candidatus Nomurabacteria bacterium]|jgi:DNA-binding MarR family transcriptional regulator|nr:hypothetical protein [Candidatus Nomurabacteria bacterium]
MPMKKPVTKTRKEFDIAELQALLNVFKHTFGDLYRKEVRTMHCSMSHLEIMQYLGEQQHPTMKDIAHHLRITPPSATTLIDAMVGNKLVKRENAVGDRRSVRVILTPQAKKVQQSLQKKKTVLLTALLKKLSLEQKQQLSAIIRTLVK